MTAVFIVSVVFAGIVLALAIICGTILLSMRIRHGGISRKSRKAQSEEARMFQEIYHGLSSMEKRVDSLETILLDKTGKDCQK